MLVRCLLDSGSQRTYVTADCAEQLGLCVIRHDYISSQSFGGHSTPPASVPVVELGLASRHGGGKCTVEALVTDTITTSTLHPHLRHLQLADSIEHSALEIGVLIGLDHYWEVVGSEVRRGPPEAPTAICHHCLVGLFLARQLHTQMLLCTASSSPPSARPSSLTLWQDSGS